MKKGWLLSGAVGLALVLVVSAYSYADPEGAAGLEMGKVAVEHVDAVRLAQGAEKPVLEFSGLLDVYYTMNFVNTTANATATGFTSAGPRYNLLRWNKLNNQIAVEVLQLRLKNAVEEAGDWGLCVKADLAGRAKQMGDELADNSFGFGFAIPQHNDIYLQELYLAYGIPLGAKAKEKGVKLVGKLGRMESLLGAEKLDVELNPNYSLGHIRNILPASGTGISLELAALNDALNVGVRILNGEELIGFVNSPFGNANLENGDSNNAKTIEAAASYKYQFKGDLKPYIEGKVGIAMGPEQSTLFGAGCTSDAWTFLDVVVRGGLLVKSRPLDVTLEYMLARFDFTNFFGNKLDASGLAATVSYQLHDRMDVALRVEYLEDHDGVIPFFTGFNPGNAAGNFGPGGPSIFSVTLTLKGKLTTDGRLVGVLEYRHDSCSTDASIPGNGIFWDDSSATSLGQTADAQDTVTLAMLLSF